MSRQKAGLKPFFANRILGIFVELTLRPIRHIFRRAGAKRISDKAIKELAKILEERAKEILVEAKKLSEHAGRRTVMKQDIKMARKTVEKK